MRRETAKWKPHEAQSTDAERRGGSARMSVESSVMGEEQRGWVIQLWKEVNQ